MLSGLRYLASVCCLLAIAGLISVVLMLSVPHSKLSEPPKSRLL